MWMQIRSLACALGLSLFLAGCGGGGEGSLPPGGAKAPTESSQPDADPSQPEPGAPDAVSKTATVSGTVTDEKGDPVAGATVKAGGQMTVTNDKGQYTVTIEAPSALAAAVAVEAGGYRTMAKETRVVAGDANTRDITLQAVDVEQDFEAADGVTVIVNGAVVVIPPNAIKDYGATVHLTASYRNPTTDDGVDAFLQPYAGIDDDQQTVNLQTVGVIEVTLSDGQGKPLSLSQPATLIYPGVSDVDHGMLTIPLWWYDTGKGIWVREGEAVRQEDGSYKGEVSHFTAWNLDVKWSGQYTSATVNYCVNFKGGEPNRQGIEITLTGPGFSYNVYSDPLEKGAHSVLNVPANTPLELQFRDGGDGKVKKQTVTDTGLAPGETKDMPCMDDLVGTGTYVPPPPPAPITASTPPSFFKGMCFVGSFGPGYTGSVDRRTVENGRLFFKVADGTGKIELTTNGSEYSQLSNPQAMYVPMKIESGRMIAGGYFEILVTGASLRKALEDPDGFFGPIRFTGQVLMMENSSSYQVTGGWRYLEANDPQPVNSSGFDLQGTFGPGICDVP
jgi:predicted small lipoprotein YifL